MRSDFFKPVSESALISFMNSWTHHRFWADDGAMGHSPVLRVLGVELPRYKSQDEIYETAVPASTTPPWLQEIVRTEIIPMLSIGS